MIKGNIIYTFDYNFQQEDHKFEFNDKCTTSTYVLKENRENDIENGIYFERINDQIHLRKYDISENDFYNFLEEKGLEEDNYPEPQIHIFYTWEKLWKKYLKHLI